MPRSTVSWPSRLGLGRHSQPYGHVEELPDDQRRDEHERAYRHHAEQMDVEPGTTGDGGRQRSPYAAHEVGGDGADHVVDLDLFEQFDRQRAQHAADGADDLRAAALRVWRSTRRAAFEARAA